MQAVILELEMPKDGVLTAEFNGKKFEHTLGELLEGSRSHFMIGWLKGYDLRVYGILFHPLAEK